MRAIIRINLEPKKEYIDLWRRLNLNEGNQNINDARLLGFSWEKIPGENVRLVAFLTFLGFNWVQNAIIEKSDDSEKIDVYDGRNSISLILNKEKTQVIIQNSANTNIYHKLDAKTENGKINIYYKDSASKFEEYYKKVLQLFDEVGYAPRLTWKDGIRFDITAKNIYDFVPEDLKQYEMQHLIMSSYTPGCQAYYIVSAINPGELHIRLRADSLLDIRDACLEFHDKIRYSKRIGLKLEHNIEVLEPNYDVPMIRGYIIDNTYKQILYNRSEVTIICFSLCVTILLSILAPFLADPISMKLTQYSAKFSAIYVQSNIERLYSAFLGLNFALTTGLYLKLQTLKKDAPIKWNLLR